MRRGNMPNFTKDISVPEIVKAKSGSILEDGEAYSRIVAA